MNLFLSINQRLVFGPQMLVLYLLIDKSIMISSISDSSIEFGLVETKMFNKLKIIYNKCLNKVITTSPHDLSGHKNVNEILLSLCRLQQLKFDSLFKFNFNYFGLVLRSVWHRMFGSSMINCR